MSIGTEHNRFAIDQRAIDGQGSHRFRDPRQPIGEVGSVSGPQGDAISVLARDQPVAVVLDLVNPVVRPCRRLEYQCRTLRPERRRTARRLDINSKRRGTFGVAGAASGSGASKAIVDNGSITFSDVSPVIVSRSISGSGSIIVNEGSVTFNGAITGSETVTVENTADAIFNTPIAGTGSFVVRNGGRLEFGAADSENVRFAAGSTGTLKIDHSLTAPFTGTIAGLTKNDSVDLADLTWVKGQMHATFSGNTAGGVLTVTDGSHSVKLNLSGNYTTSTWALSRDGSGGTAVTDPPAHNSDDYDLLVGPVSGTGEFNLSGRSPPESGAGVSSGQTLTFGAGATDELIGSAYSFDGMVDDYFANGDAAIANAFAESARVAPPANGRGWLNADADGRGQLGGPQLGRRALRSERFLDHVGAQRRGARDQVRLTCGRLERRASGLRLWANSFRSTVTTNESEAPESGRRRYGSLARRADVPSRVDDCALAETGGSVASRSVFKPEVADEAHSRVSGGVPVRWDHLARGSDPTPC